MWICPAYHGWHVELAVYLKKRRFDCRPMISGLLPRCIVDVSVGSQLRRRVARATGPAGFLPRQAKRVTPSSRSTAGSAVRKGRFAGMIGRAREYLLYFAGVCWQCD